MLTVKMQLENTRHGGTGTSNLHEKQVKPHRFLKKATRVFCQGKSVKNKNNENYTAKMYLQKADKNWFFVIQDGHSHRIPILSIKRWMALRRQWRTSAVMPLQQHQSDSTAPWPSNLNAAQLTAWLCFWSYQVVSSRHWCSLDTPRTLDLRGMLSNEKNNCSLHQIWLEWPPLRWTWTFALVCQISVTLLTDGPTGWTDSFRYTAVQNSCMADMQFTAIRAPGLPL